MAWKRRRKWRLRRAVLEDRHSVHREMLRYVERCDLDKLRKRTMSATQKLAKRSAGLRDQAQITAAYGRAARRASRHPSVTAQR